MDQSDEKKRMAFGRAWWIIIGVLAALAVGILWQMNVLFKPIFFIQEYETVEDRIKPQYKIALMDPASLEEKEKIPGEWIVKNYCASCHESGLSGAPKFNHPLEWKEIFQQGEEAMVKSVIEGKGAMPPKGGFTRLTDPEIVEAVRWMAESLRL